MTIEISDELVEAGARAVCRALDLNDDEHWQRYTMMIPHVLAAVAPLIARDVREQDAQIAEAVANCIASEPGPETSAERSGVRAAGIEIAAAIRAAQVTQ